MSARVPNSNVPPYDAIGLLRMPFNDGETYRGSGCLVSDRHVLTCAHNVTAQRKPTVPHPPFATAMQLYPRWNSTRFPAGGVAARNAFFPSPYRDGEDAWDIAVVLLNAPAPAPVAYFQPQSTNGGKLIHEVVTLTGYPGNHGGEMWTDNDEVAGVAPEVNRVLFTNDTDGGSSGSPIYQYDSVGEVVRLYGVHNSENRAFGLRSGLLFTPVVHQWLQRALAEGPDDRAFAIGLDL